MPFSLEVLVFLFSHFVCLLLFAVLTILLTVLRLLFLSALFPGNTNFLLPHLSFISFFIVSLVTHFTIPLGQCPPNTHFKFAYYSSLFLPQQKPQWPEFLLSCWEPNLKRGFSSLFTSFLFHCFFFNVIISLFHNQNNLLKAAPVFIVFWHLPWLSSLNFP